MDQLENIREKKLLPTQREAILSTVKERFNKNMNRHEGIIWEEIVAKLDKAETKLWSLHEMERTGGEPDVVAYDKNSEEYIFYDCSAESPSGRRNLCYDPESLASRKTFKPGNSALGLAEEMGIELLTEEEYRNLQVLGLFDQKTSSWLKTPSDIRALGGAIFADRRYNTIFCYHNGAESYYGSRGFRGSLRV